MLSVQNRSQVEYSKCNQTVTIYHADGGAYTKQVVANAFLDFRKNQTIDKTGSKEANSFLLVIPCTTQCVFVGDKVLMGAGADVTTREEWANLIPTKMPGLVVVKYVDPKYWNGALIHVEAGG